MTKTFNNKVRQIILLVLIILIAFVLVRQLYTFLPAFLGAVTLYILLREPYFNLTIKKKWRKGGTALGMVLMCIIGIALPLYFSIQLLSNKLKDFLSNPTQIMADATLVAKKIETTTGFELLTQDNIAMLQKQATTIIPSVLNSSATILGNLAMMFFLLYFLLKSGRELERFLEQFIPLKDENVDLIADETKSIIKSNAIGIPVLAVLQGLVATIGYTIFGVKDAVLWGFITGVFSMVPIVGTAIIWVPLTLYLFAVNQQNHAIGLLIYSAVIITNIDYVARLTILKKFLDVHPLITILGVLVGLGLFGFWGVIFGPLLISYFVMLTKIYLNEFSVKQKVAAD